MEKKFTALRVIGTVFKVLAWISLIFWLLVAVGSLIVMIAGGRQQWLLGLDLVGPLAGVAMLIVFLIIAIISFLVLYAVGESFYLFLSIEENTRHMAYSLQQQYTAQQSAYPSPAEHRPYPE